MNNLTFRLHRLKIVLTVLSLALLVVGCTSEPSLQEYIVDSAERPGFMSTSVPLSMMPVETSELTDDSREAYSSVRKANALLLPRQGTDSMLLEQEKKKLNNVMASDRYTNLISHKDDGMKIVLTYEGDKADGIDEMVLYGYQDSLGLGVVRIMGENMQPNKIVRLIRELQQNSMDNDLDGQKSKDNDLISVINRLKL